jgi:hypothetical protein
LKQISNRKGDAICQKQDIFKGLMWFYTNNFANWHILKLKSTGNRHCKLKNKVSSLEDYAVEVIQETEKILIMLWGESLTRLINLKRKKKQNKKPKSAVENRPTGENKIIANNKKPINTGASENLQ